MRTYVLKFEMKPLPLVPRTCPFSAISTSGLIWPVAGTQSQLWHIILRHAPFSSGTWRWTSRCASARMQGCFAGHPHAGHRPALMFSERDLQEEELISVFNKGDQAMQLQDSVEAVRVVRDSKTRIGKGIAYVLFKSRVAALAALQLNGSECKGRQMRVGRVDNSHAKVSAKGGPQGSKKARGMPRQHQEKRTDGAWHCASVCLVNFAMYVY